MSLAKLSTWCCFLVLFVGVMICSNVTCVEEKSKSVKYYSTKTIEGSTSNFDIVESKLAYMIAPSGICEGLNGEIYVSDVERHLIYRIYDENWSTLEIYAGFTTNGYNGDGQLAVGTLLNAPSAISVNSVNGDLFICDTLNGFIRIVSSSTKMVSSISKTFNKPQGISVSKNGFAYISDTNNNLIYKYEISTQILSIFGGGGSLSGIYDGVEAKLLNLKSPKNIYVVSNGKDDLVYFIDDERVKLIDQNGYYRIIDGNSPQSNLFGIYVKEGEIYTSSQSNHFIQMKMEKSSSTNLFIGNSEAGYEGDNQQFDTSSTNVKFYKPSSLIVIKNSILIADKSNNCIRKIDLLTKMVSTLAGGFINHPYGENISPLKMYNYGTLNFPFHFNNDFYFVEKLNILRKVSNGKMQTIFGSSQELKFTSNIPQRTFFSFSFLHHFGNGDLLISSLSNQGSHVGLYYFNVEKQNLTLFSTFSYYSSLMTAIGDSYENSTIYIVTTPQCNVAVYEKSKLVYNLALETSSSQFVPFLNAIPNLTINGTNSLLFFDKNENSIYEFIDYKNGTFTKVIRKLIIDQPIREISGFTAYGRILYFWMATQAFEYDWDLRSFKSIVGLYPIDSLNSTVFITGFNGDNIPAETSAIYVARNLKRQDSKIYITNEYHISQISNGIITTIAGLNPLAKSMNPIISMRDSSKKTVYYVDSKVLKKFDENLGISSSLSMYYIPSTAFYDLPFLVINFPLASKPCGLFSTFDKNIYIVETCRITRINPEKLNFEKIIGSTYCGYFVTGVKGTMSPSPASTVISGFTIDESNGDLIISDFKKQIYRYSQKSQIISLEFSFNGSNNVSSDGIITNFETNPGALFYSLYHSDGAIYIGTTTNIRKIEKLSETQYYLRTIVGTLESGYSGSGLPALESSIDSPSAMYVKKNGDIIFLDGTSITGSASLLIRMFEKKSGLLFDLAGKRVITPAFNGDGKGSDTIFSSFSKQVDYDESSGEIFFLDARLYIRKLVPQCDENYVFNSWNNTCELVLSCNGTLAVNLSVCNGNGNCLDFDTCQCKEGFEGKYCELSKIDKQTIDSSTVLIVSIVVPIIGSLILITIIVIISILVICLISRTKKKENKEKRYEITQINTESLELSDNPFPSNSSMIISSSNGSVSSSSSETENAFSRYSNIVRIGQGAFGSVFKVMDTKQGNKLKAIKVIRFESFTDLNSIMKEASQLSHIKHPNIVKVNDYFITNDNLLIIDMDYYECGDLTSLVKQQVSEKLIKQIMKQMLSALKYVHEEMHIIHRDIKPTNIFIKTLSKDNIEIVLADFGLAKKYQESKGQSYAGTPLYMSPEIALGSSYSFNTDIFSLGVSIYQIMTNDTQTSISNLLMGIQSENATQILTKQMKESSEDEYSEELIQVILKMLEKDSNQRMNASQFLSLNYFK